MSTPGSPLSFRRSPSLLERYVLKESILPFFLGFGLVTFLFILEFLFDFLDLLLAKDVPPLRVLELFVLALGWITALSFPCGALVAALMTFGRMAQDNEITAMRALGVNVARILRGPTAAAFVLAGLLILFNNYVLPETNHRFAMLRLAIHRKSPAAKIEPGIFINAFDNYSLLVQEVNAKTGELRDITIYDYTESKEAPVTIFAKTGTMKYLNHSTTLRLDLRDGEIHEVPGPATEGKYRRGKFQENTLYLQNSGAILQIPENQSRGEREMNIAMLHEEIAKREAQKERRYAQIQEKLAGTGFRSPHELETAIYPPTGLAAVWHGLLGLLGGGGRRAPPPDVDPELMGSLRVELVDIQNIDRRIDSFWVEIHKKFSIPFACVVFVLVGGPLGIRTRKGGFANMAIAVGFFIVYYLFLIAGEQLADRRFLSPFLAMWLPNIFFGIIGVYLTASVTGLGPSRGMR
jgi:lipopolysaccharide export system permease protein